MVACQQLAAMVRSLRRSGIFVACARLAARGRYRRGGARSPRRGGKEFRHGFGNALSEQASDELHERRAIPSPAKPLFQAAVANFTLHAQSQVDTANASRSLLLLISGTADHTVPDVTTRATLKQYRDSAAVTEFKQFEGRGHSLTIDGDWRDVARRVPRLAPQRRALSDSPAACPPCGVARPGTN
jgi:hypothetical protein